jgi:hypothetical protein
MTTPDPSQKAYDSLYTVMASLSEDEEIPVTSLLDALAIHTILLVSKTNSPSEAHRYFLEALDRTINKHLPSLKSNQIDESESIPRRPHVQPKDEPKP